MKLALALELLKAGLQPQLAASAVAASWPMIGPTAYLSTWTAEDFEAGIPDVANIDMMRDGCFADWDWIVAFNALRDLIENRESGDFGYDRIFPSPRRGALKVARALQLDLAKTSFGNPRNLSGLVIDGSRLVRTLMSLMTAGYGYAKEADLRQDLADDMHAAGVLRDDFVERAKIAPLMIENEKVREEVVDWIAREKAAMPVVHTCGPNSRTFLRSVLSTFGIIEVPAWIDVLHDGSRTWGRERFSAGRQVLEDRGIIVIHDDPDDYHVSLTPFGAALAEECANAEPYIYWPNDAHGKDVDDVDPQA